MEEKDYHILAESDTEQRPMHNSKRRVLPSLDAIIEEASRKSKVTTNNDNTTEEDEASDEGGNLQANLERLPTKGPSEYPTTEDTPESENKPNTEQPVINPLPFPPVPQKKKRKQQKNNMER